MATQTTYQHKNDKSIVKTFIELQKEFTALRYSDDEFARDYASHEINQWINRNYDHVKEENVTDGIQNS